MRLHLNPTFAAAALLAVGSVAFLSHTAASGEDNGASGELPKAKVDLPAPAPDEHSRTAVLAAGCFWGNEAAFEQLKGVKGVTAGYAGGDAKTADYEHYHDSNHAEAVKIDYDPHEITYGELLRVLFTISQPTVKDRQGPDAGHGYRMAVFYADAQQKQVAEGYVEQLKQSKLFADPIVTTVEPMPEGFFPAEAYHQHYVQLHPREQYVVYESLPKIAKVREKFPDEVKAEAK